MGAWEEQVEKRRLKEEQVKHLELSFRKDRNLETLRKVQLTSELGLGPKRVAVCFQNRRARHKRRQMEDQLSSLRAAHDAIVVDKCRLENEVLRLKEKVAQMEEEKERLLVTLAASGMSAGVVSGPSLSFPTVTHQPLPREFALDGDAAELTYDFYMIDLATGFYGT